MGALRLFTSLFSGLATMFRSGLTKIYGVFLNKETNQFMNPRVFKALIAGTVVIFFGFVVISTFMKGDPIKNKAFEDYEKEARISSGVRAREFGKGTVTPLQMGAKNGTSGTYGDGTATLSQSSGGAQSLSECYDLVDRLKKGEELSTQDTSKVNACLDSGALKIPEEEQKVLKALASNELSKEERERLRAGLNKDASPESRALANLYGESKKKDKDAVVDDINKNLKTKITPDGFVSGVSKALKEGAEKYKDGLLAMDQGRKAPVELNPAQKTSIKDLIFGKKDELADPTLISDKKSALDKLTSDIKDRQAEIDAKKQELADLQAQAKAAAEKIAQGRPLNPSETKAISDVATTSKEISDLEAKQADRTESLKELTDDIRVSLAEAVGTIKSTLPSGVTAYDFETGPDGLPVLPKTKKSKKKLDKVAFKPQAAPTPKPLRIARLKDDEIKALAGPVALNAQKTTNVLPADAKILATLDSEIAVASNKLGQLVRVKTEHDVYDSRNGKIVVPKGSVVTGRVNSFDENTGYGDITLSRVIVGGKSIDVRLRAGSVDGFMGVGGEVYDQRGRYLTGAFITAFSAGVLEYFSNSVLAQYQSATTLSNALIGATGSGAAEVMKKLSEMTAQDLQNAPKLFYVKRGVPIVLYVDN